MKTDHNMTALADDLGVLKAEIASLTVREKELKAEIVSTGQDALDGELYRVTVAHSEAKGLNTDRVRALLDELVGAGTISPQRRAAMFKVSERTTVRVTAKVRA